MVVVVVGSLCVLVVKLGEKDSRECSHAYQEMFWFGLGLLLFAYLFYHLVVALILLLLYWCTSYFDRQQQRHQHHHIRPQNYQQQLTQQSTLYNSIH